MAYLLDANIFIQAKNREYGFDFCPAFWEWIDTAHAAGVVHSIDAVHTELIGWGDDLSDWAKARPAGFFRQPDTQIVAALGTLAQWANGADYEQTARATFLNGADAQLIAHAIARGDTVVTHEVPGGSRKRIKIPEAAVAHGVRYVNPYQLLRIEQARFVLGPPPTAAPEAA